MRYALIAFLGFSMFAVSAAASTSSRPNIVYILADDLGYGDLSCYGQTKEGGHEVDVFDSNDP